ncbi:hypothetical protein CP157_01106 [Paracoccus marcusii]|uniref:hypothetical protein n=1 Tax=Paracoccus marcusii TaxID=59779 RepID=UPI001C3CB614|nr:hypothetical protein [Paracoccus marcusii]QXI63388.1 hypothetical protein CP157_01106 [Paracoccus marcusii]
MTDPVQIPVRVISETDRAWLMTTQPFGSRFAHWEPKSRVQIPDINEIKPMLTALMSRDYAVSRGWIK